MIEETRIQIERWFDGESNGKESSKMDAIFAADPEARRYSDELNKTREALKAAHRDPGLEVPSWNQVREHREERNSDPSPRVVAFPRVIAAMAAIIVFGMLLWIPFRDAGMRSIDSIDGLSVEAVEMVETDLVGATPVVYLDQPSGWTVIWVLEKEERSDI